MISNIDHIEIFWYICVLFSCAFVNVTIVRTILSIDHIEYLWFYDVPLLDAHSNGICLSFYNHKQDMPGFRHRFPIDSDNFTQQWFIWMNCFHVPNKMPSWRKLNITMCIVYKENLLFYDVFWISLSFNNYLLLYVKGGFIPHDKDPTSQWTGI